MDSQLETVQQRLRTVEGRIVKAEQDLAAAKQDKDGEKQGKLLYLLVTLHDQKNILLRGQALGMAAQGTVRKWGSNMVNVKVKGEAKRFPLQLYLAAGESDQATSGHIFMANIRDILHGLPADVPIKCCEDVHAMRLEGEWFLPDMDDLSEKRFTAGAELMVWPGTLEARVVQMVESAYSTLCSKCQHVLALLTVGIKSSKED